MEEPASEVEICGSECSVCQLEAEERSISVNLSSGVGSKLSEPKVFEIDPKLASMIRGRSGSHLNLSESDKEQRN